MKKPRLPKRYHKNPRILSDEQIKEAKELLKENSQRWVARYFNVSRGCIVRYCIPGMREYYMKKSKEWNKAHPEITRMRRNSCERKRMKLLNKLFPDKMKEYRKYHRQKIGREYFKQKLKEFRSRNSALITN